MFLCFGIPMCVMNILCTFPVFMYGYVTSAVVDSIVVVVALTRYVPLLYSVWDLKATKINEQESLIREHMLHEFEQGHNTMEANENICWVEVENAVDHSRVTR